MGNRKLKIMVVIVLIATSSCTTIFNRRYSEVSLKTSSPALLVIGRDTIESNPDIPSSMVFINEKAPVIGKVINQGSTKDFQIWSRKGALYWANLMSPYALGFLVDEIGGKKFSYPRNVYINLEEEGNSILPYFPYDYGKVKQKNKLFLSPITVVGYYHPAIELGYERIHNNDFSTQITYGLLLNADNEFARNSKGFNAGLEWKFFFRNAEKYRLYYSMSFEYLRKNHMADIGFTVVNGDPDVDNYFRQSTEIEKRFFSMTPHIGIQKYLSERWVLDSFFGVGIRHRSVKHLNVNPLFQYSDFDESWFFDIESLSNEPADRFTLNFDLNFRIGWVF